jgi:3-methyladenine DNA glycosylase/8-oxoguanine DNA glycosylase
VNLALAARPPFNLASTVRSHGWWQLQPFLWDEASGLLTYTGRLSSGRVLEVQVRDAPGAVSVHSEGSLEPEEESEVAGLVTWMLSLDQDLAPFHEMARQEPKLEHVVEKGLGRILRSFTLFEDTVKTILTTNTSWAGTIRMVEALVTVFGTPSRSSAQCRAFPSATDLAALDEESLRHVARLGYRAPYVLSLARSVASGELDLEGLKAAGLPTGELRRRLLAIKGIGPYAAANLLMLLDHYDFIPVDSWAFKVVSHEWYGGQPVGATEVEEAFARWGDWKGLAYWFWNWSFSGET